MRQNSGICLRNFLEELCKCLLLLQIATTALGYSKQVSLSIVQPLVHCLIKTHLVKEIDNEHTAVQKFKEIVASARELKQHFPLSAMDPPPPSLLASALDPRYKTLDFISEAHHSAVWESIKADMPIDVASVSGGEVIETPSKKKKAKQDINLSR